VDLSRSPGGIQEKNCALSNIYSILQHLTAFDRSGKQFFSTKGVRCLRVTVNVPFKPPPITKRLATNSTKNDLFFTVFYLILQYFKYLALFLKKGFPSATLSFKAK
jgi:hypothetical protein